MKVTEKKMTDTSEKVINNKNNDYDDDNHETTCYDSKYIYIERHIQLNSFIYKTIAVAVVIVKSDVNV